MTAVALAVVGGVAWALAAPPRGWWPLLAVGVAVLTLALYGRRAGQRFGLGLVVGVTFFAPNLWWLTDFSVPGYVAVVLLETGLLAAAVTVVPAAHRGTWNGVWWSVPAALVLLEWAQARFPLGGFPLPALGLSQASSPYAAAAPLGGTLLVTAAAATGGVALAALVIVPGLWRRVAAASGLLLLSAVPALIGSGVATRPAGALDVALVQGGGPRGLRAVFTDPAAVTARHLTVAGKIAGSPDLVLFPENVVDVDGRLAGSPEEARLAALASRLDATLVAGVTESTRSRFRNAAVLWGPDGSRLARYDKEHRVPFGEYIPARRFFERVTDATALVPRDAVPGRGEALLRSSVGPLGVVISYEVFFPDRVRESVSAGGRVVLVPTNASSYLSEEVPAMEVAAARLRAREFGRTVLQSAPTGYSVVVLPDGRVLACSRLGSPDLLRRTVPQRTELTPYAKTGDGPVVALAAATLAVPRLTGRTPSRRYLTSTYGLRLRRRSAAR